MHKINSKDLKDALQKLGVPFRESSSSFGGKKVIIDCSEKEHIVVNLTKQTLYVISKYNYAGIEIAGVIGLLLKLSGSPLQVKRHKIVSHYFLVKNGYAMANLDNFIHKTVPIYTLDGRSLWDVLGSEYHIKMEGD